MSTVEELHQRWSRDADYREAYERLGPEFEVARAHRGAPARRVHAGGVGRADEDHAIGGGAAGERPGAAVHAHAGEGGESDRDPAADPIRARVDRCPTRTGWSRRVLTAFGFCVRTGNVMESSKLAEALRRGCHV